MKKFMVDSSEYPIVVDYSRSLEEMIKADNYKDVDGDITEEHFPLKGIGRQEVIITIIYFEHGVTSEKVFTETEKAGFRLSKIEELLALVEKYPEIHRKFLIGVLGSVWEDGIGNRWMPFLACFYGKHILRLRLITCNWHKNWRFAVVRK